MNINLPRLFAAAGIATASASAALPALAQDVSATRSTTSGEIQANVYSFSDGASAGWKMTLTETYVAPGQTKGVFSKIVGYCAWTTGGPVAILYHGSTSETVGGGYGCQDGSPMQSTPQFPLTVPPIPLGNIDVTYTSVYRPSGAQDQTTITEIGLHYPGYQAGWSGANTYNYQAELVGVNEYTPYVNETAGVDPKPSSASSFETLLAQAFPGRPRVVGSVSARAPAQ